VAAIQAAIWAREFEAEFVQGVADAAFLGAFGDEQAGADPLVDQTVRDERRDLILALP
jgi:hypothetical protein